MMRIFFLSLTALLALAPMLHVNSHDLPSGLFYITLTICLALLVYKRFYGAGSIFRRYWPVLAAFSLLLLAVINSSIAYGDWPGANGEGAIRLMLGLALPLLALSYVPQSTLRQCVWGFPITAGLSFFIVLWLTLPGFVRPETPGHIPVAYGAFMSLLAAITVFSMGWQLTKAPRAELFVKLLLAILGFGALVLTQTRTGWLGVPIFILLAVFLFLGLRNRLKAAVIIVLAATVAAGVFYSSDVLRDKAMLAYTEARECTGANSTKDTSICIRFQMWRASLDMLEQNPWIGIGDGSLFQPRMVSDSYPKGLVSKFVISAGFGEPHNDIIFMAAAFGIPGAFAMLLIYLVPGWYFLRRMSQKMPMNCRVAAAMGLALCAGFFVFGLTELMFRRMHVLGFYALFVAVFLSLSDSTRYKNGSAPKGS